MRRFWLWIFRYALRKIDGGWGLCANRSWKSFVEGKLEYTITCRNTTEPDAYSREEVYEMLRKVRTQERVSRWKCPEPEL